MGNLIFRRPLGIPVCSILLASAIGASVSAVANPQLPGQTAKFGDLNISTPAGAAVLYDRIVLAAQGVCSYYWFKTDADESRCIHDAIVTAVTRVNQPALSVVYNAKNPAPPPPALASQSR